MRTGNHLAARVRRALACAAAAAALLLGAGCGSRPEKTPEGRTILYIWSGWTGKEKDIFEVVVDAFNRSQEDYELRNMSIEGDDTKTIRALTAGVPPDLFFLWEPAYIGQLAANKAVMPLNPLLERTGPPLEDFIPGSIGQGEWEGKFYSLPYLLDAYAIYWDKDAFREVGLNPERPPRTLRELEEYTVKLLKRDERGNVQRLGFQLPDIFHPIVWFGGTFYDAKTRRITADNPRNVEALEWYVHMMDIQGGALNIDSFSQGFGEYASSNNQFFVGKVAMTISGQWWPGFIERFAPHMDYGVAPIPYPDQYPEQKGVTYLGGNFCCIPRESRHPEGAWTFMRWTQTYNGQELFAKDMHGVPNMKPVLNDPVLVTGSRHNEAFGVVCNIGGHPNARFFPATPVNIMYMTELVTAAQLAARGARTAENALRDVQRRVQKELNTYY
ncbi:MAG: ABC transporter substrate-binding protein [Armatimonadota bacterium]|nr:MAG: ABC transporter substrate-binding protein [Armatimonadota bacterium]